jgi:hypothetical protein
MYLVPEMVLAAAVKLVAEIIAKLKLSYVQ